jgi:uroporphyrin-III C-methyltransferase/precorrin-2 dehydrogenase/sirohydrochlorin ferrochelatase
VDRLPLFLDLKGQTVLVVGGGAIAARKCRLLANAGARIRLVALEVTDPALADAVRHGRVQLTMEAFAELHVDGVCLVIAATGRRDVNSIVAAAARQRGVWVNVVDDAALSSVMLPSIVDRSPLIVAISTGGASPVLARRIRERLEAMLEPSLGPLAKLLGAWRRRLMARWPRPVERRQVMDRLLDGGLPALVAEGRRAEAEAVLRTAVQTSVSSVTAPAGRVCLVGAGPGDPELLTIKALRALQRADLVLHDRLVSPAILELARRDADVVDVGKTGGGPGTCQEHIHELMVKHAGAGRNVVRLKGGDPFVFGRGAEEVEALRRAGIAVDIVPGITAALALCLAGIPLTHRRATTGIQLLTAQRAADAPEPDWQSWANSRDTLVFYMGVGALALIREKLLNCGMKDSTPIAVVEHLSLPTQRAVVATLQSALAANLYRPYRSPSILVIGAAAAHAHTAVAAIREAGQAA